MLIYETILTDVIQQIAVLKENRTTQLKPKIQQSAQQESLGKCKTLRKTICFTM